MIRTCQYVAHVTDVKEVATVKFGFNVWGCVMGVNPPTCWETLDELRQGWCLDYVLGEGSLLVATTGSDVTATSPCLGQRGDCGTNQGHCKNHQKHPPVWLEVLNAAN